MRSKQKNSFLKAAGAILLAGILAAGICCMGYVSRGEDGKWFRNGNIPTWHWKDTVKEELPPAGTSDGGGGGAVISGTEENGIQLLNAALPRSAFAANGISENAESAYQLTATLSPASATNVTLEWSVEFSDPSNAWAMEKDPSDYITVTSAEADSKVAMVACMEQFGAQIIVRVSASAPDCETKTAECAVDYLQKVETFSLSFGDVNCNFGGNTDVIVQFNKNGVMKGGEMIETLRTSEVYSIADEFQVEYSLTPCKPYLYNLQGKVTEGVFGEYSTTFYSFGKGSLSGDDRPKKIEDMEKIPPLDYSVLTGYSVSENGLYFGVKFFCDHLGFSSYYCHNQSGSDGNSSKISLVNYSDDDMDLIGEIFDKINQGGTYNDGYWDYFFGGLDLFNLRVKVTGEHSEFEKSTTFHTAAYTIALDSVSLDNSTVVI